MVILTELLSREGARHPGPSKFCQALGRTSIVKFGKTLPFIRPFLQHNRKSGVVNPAAFVAGDKKPVAAMLLR
jgi:hypothetical protein